MKKASVLEFHNLENREIADVIKLSLRQYTSRQSNEEIQLTLEGMSTPNTTLTITTKDHKRRYS